MNINENLRIGDRVTGTWGAMHPTSIGTVVQIDADRSLGVKVEWDDEYPSATGWYDVYAKGSRSPNGSPVGVFLHTAY
jgi:hypothetical protein